MWMVGILPSTAQSAPKGEAEFGCAGLGYRTLEAFLVGIA